MRKRSEVAKVTDDSCVSPEEKVLRGQDAEDPFPSRGLEIPDETIEFENPHAATEAPFEPGFQRIVETVYCKDTYETYLELVEFLKPKEQRTTRDLDNVEFMARKAHDLWMTAKRERTRWEMDNKVIFAAMHERSALDLQREKDSGQRSKQITDADIQARCALNWPDEYRAQELRQRYVKTAEESMANLYAVFELKCRNMATVVSKQR